MINRYLTRFDIAKILKVSPKQAGALDGPHALHSDRQETPASCHRGGLVFSQAGGASKQSPIGATARPIAFLPAGIDIDEGTSVAVSPSTLPRKNLAELEA